MLTGFDGKAGFSSIPRGWHWLNVRRKGYYDYERWIWVEDSTQFTVELIPRPSRAKRIWHAIETVATLFTLLEILNKAAEVLRHWLVHFHDTRARL